MAGTQIYRPLTIAICTTLAGCAAAQRNFEAHGFTPEAARHLAELVEKRQGLVVFDADGTIWRNDFGEDLLNWQIEHRILALAHLNRMKQELVRYKSGTVDERGFWIDAAICQEGLSERQVIRDCETFAERTIRGKVYEPVAYAIQRLKSADIDVWVCSASHKWIILAAAKRVGVRPDHVIAVTAVVRDGIITNDVEHPVPYRQGKADAIKIRIGRTPDIVFGNSAGDTEMLMLASKAAIIINPGEELRKIATEKGWFTQSFR